MILKKIAACALASLAICTSSTATGIELKNGDVVAFVGGTDMVRMQQEGRFEAGLTKQFLKLLPKFRDLAWDGDTVYFQSTIKERWRPEAFGDWDRQLKRVGATMVIAQFGKIESIDGGGRIEAFSEAYRKLLDQLGADGRRMILIEPLRPQWKNSDTADFPLYLDAIQALARERKIPFLTRGDVARIEGAAPVELVEAVREKHRLWYEYWRPSNWKCLFGDDSKRIFSNAADGLPSFKQEWKTYPSLIAAAEGKIFSGELIEPKPAPRRTGSDEADIAKELAAFEVLDGFEVNLFADQSQGISNPLSVRWSGDGKMYVACSDTYPQVEPGVKPDDRIISLRDKDENGVADAWRVFAGGLKIPTGMEVGAEGVYVGQGTELLFIDWKGNRKVLLSGFGNGDSHQTSNSFVWSPGGELWWCQGDGIESRVETPFGISSLFQAGVFRLRPGELRLDGLLDDFMGPGNPWGVAFDDYGQSFVIDGAGGISYLTPASIPVKRRLRLPRIGQPGGYCGIECIGARTLPEEMQGQFLIGDYKKNQVSRFATVEDGSGFKVEFKKPLLRSKHRNFRPVDVKVGPDGAIYVVDWYNPITCHQDDFYRHPARDKTHGRIWRVSRTVEVIDEDNFNQPKSAFDPPGLTSKKTGELLDALHSPERWTRLKAKQILATRERNEVLETAARWAANAEGRLLMEAASLFEWLDEPNGLLAARLLSSPDHRCRAYAARVVGRWGTRLDNSLELLEIAATDEHPRVRMEALLACAHIPDPRSVLIAASVSQKPRDRWIDYAFSQAVHHLKPLWLPAFKRGELDFGEQASGLAAVLGQSDSNALLAEIRTMVAKGPIGDTAKVALVRALISAGEEEDLRFALNADPPSAALLKALSGREQPGFEVATSLGKVLACDDHDAVAAAMELVGHWRVEELYPQALKVVKETGTHLPTRAAAIRALGVVGNGGGLGVLEGIAERMLDPHQATAVGAIFDIDLEKGARVASRLLLRSHEEKLTKDVFTAIAAREGAGALVARELGQIEVFSMKQGQRIRGTWVGAGFVDEDLSRQLDKLAHFKVEEWKFGDDLVKKLVMDARSGDPSKGKSLFASSKLGCAVCHTVGNKGGTLGPDLSAVGSGVPPERIVTEVLWPSKQVKEGFALRRYTKKNGTVLQGYEQKSRDEKLVLVRDFAAGTLHEIPTNSIVKRDDLGSLMPPTAQALSREQVRDLLAYLFGLDGS